LTVPSGYSFAADFVDYLQGKDIATGSVGRVAANPQQSKHLETGTTRILGLECDFVGLRSETYTDSRIPDQVQLGTPLEDASRRDLTINALFYNVRTRKVEDHTGKGLDDLSNRIARTPLAPDQTFQDDPLRLLRCIRFASRFNLTIAEDVGLAMQQEPIKASLTIMSKTDRQAALQTKVSKERVGIETVKMLKHDPFRAISLIHDFGLHSSIFTCAVDPPRDSAILASRILKEMATTFPPDEMLWLAAWTSPFRGLVVKGKKELPAVSVLLADGLKVVSILRQC
jgi:tRNA nucleotidyltransferase (CCA-adding enzyme)